MAGRPRSSSFAIPSSYLIAGLTLLALASIFFLLLSPSRFDPDRNPTTLPFPRNSNTATPEYSFVASLEKFLTSRPRPPAISDTAAGDDGGTAVTALDDAIWRSAAEGLLRDPSDPWSRLSVVRVYVYEMPSKFTYDLLWLFRNTYKETANLTSNGSPVHRLIEQKFLTTGMADKSWSTDYWRKFFRYAVPDIFHVIEKAILVAASDRPDEFADRSDHIAKTLYTCCSGCVRSELRAPEELEEDGDIKEESRIVGEVITIKGVLANQHHESDEVLFESLQRLQSMDLSVETLQATEIGRSANYLRKHNSKQNIQHLAQNLIEGWKGLVDDWVKATANTPPESVNPSVVSEEDGLLSADEGVLLASETKAIEPPKFDEKNESKTQIEDEGRARRKEAVTTPPKPKLTANKPPRPPNSTVGGQVKPAGTDLGPGRPSKLAFEQEATGDMKYQPPMPSPSIQESDELSVAKLEIAKRKLRDGYQQAENAKKKRAIQVVELKELLRPGYSNVVTSANSLGRF